MWTDSTDRNAANVGRTQLRYVNMPESLLVGTYAVSADQGSLSLTVIPMKMGQISHLLRSILEQMGIGFVKF